nr:cysteine-rich receptor-like protein kinase 10 [Ziziphus jujuba var. spinosa]
MQSLPLYALILLLLFSYIVEFTEAQDSLLYNYCNSALYTSGSVYEKNLNLTLTLLAANAYLNGFYNVSVGNSLNTVYGLAQCISNVSDTDCQNCVNKASKSIRGFCPNQKEASMGYKNCLIRYSSQRFFSTSNSNRRYSLANPNNVTDPVLWNRQLGSLLQELSSNAASAPSRFAVGSTNYKDSDNLYAMVQCTRDLAEDSCLSCLHDVIGHISEYCYGKIGCRICSLSCTLRYESYFFLLSAPPPSDLTSPSPVLDRNCTTSQDKRNPTKAVTVVIPVVVSFLVILIICTYLTRRNAKRKRADGVESFLIGLRTLKVATENFSNAQKLGEGGFGAVYKGKLDNGQEIAVKKLSSQSVQGLDELKAEVMVVSKLLHRNLVRLLGFCLEDGEKLLVYEYLPNGGLDKILFDGGKHSSLEWETRYKIILGIARGLLYLHEDSQVRIVHRDLKASNILLDADMTPKISDFGQAKLFCGSQSQGNTNRTCGTFGYMAPEYSKNGNFSTKSDVYSFGILVLEIITGQKSSSFRNLSNLQSLAWQHWSNGKALELVDRAMGGKWPRHEALNCISIGLLCVQEAAADRPKMSEVSAMLSSSSTSTLVPSRPAYFAEIPYPHKLTK